MREGRQLVRETSRFAVENRPRSWWHLAATVVAFAAVLFVASASGLSWIARLAASVLVALLHVRMFVIYHDHQHGAVLQGSTLAGALFRLYGLVTLTPASIWKETHDHHHLNNTRSFGLDSIGSYPVLTTGAWREARRGERFLYALSRHPLTIACGYLTVFLYSFCLRALFVAPRQHLDAAAALVLHLGLVAVLAFVRPDIMLFALVLPSFLASALGSYLFYAQHNFPGAKLRVGPEWDYVAAALHSSSFIRMGPVMRWFTGNIGYHHVHHLNPRIPFYRLPEAMAALEGLQHPVTTSLSPVDVVRCLRLALWDPEADRFVSFREARRQATGTRSGRAGAAATAPRGSL